MTWSDAVLQRLTPPSAQAPDDHRDRPGHLEPPPFQGTSWRGDLLSAVLLFLLAVPLCLGISLASGAPLYSGIIAGIIGGLVVGGLSGSPLMVTGPAAGLAAIVMSAIETLGSFPAFLAAVVVAGGLQMLLAAGRAGIIAYYLPSSVVRGLLTAIGIILILKQIPHALGYDVDFEGDETFLQANAENTFSAIAHAFSRIEPAAVILSLGGLAILLLWDRLPTKIRLLPGPLVVILLGVVGFELLPWIDPMFQLGPAHRVTLPVPQSLADFGQVFAFPDWTALQRPAAWQIAVTLALVASLETLLTIEATDKIDRFKREAPFNRELAVQGVGNLFAGLIGGLPIAGVIIRSAANVDAGARSKWSTVLHGLLLAAMVFFAPTWLNLIPYAAIAAVLIYTGARLAPPSMVVSMWRQGRMQFVPFAVTVVAILLTDMLVGVLVGLAVGFLFIVFDHLRHPCFTVVSPHGAVLTRLKLNEQISFLNKASLAEYLYALPPNSRLELDGRHCRYIDHDVLEFISDFRRTAPLRAIDFRVVGISLPPVSPSH